MVSHGLEQCVCFQGLLVVGISLFATLCGGISRRKGVPSAVVIQGWRDSTVVCAGTLEATVEGGG